MDKYIIKDIIISSLILGLILGIFATIPYISFFALGLLVLFVAPILMIFLIMAGKLNLSSTTDSIIQGAICGFCANLIFSLIFSAIVAIMSLFFNYSSNLFLTSMIINAPLWLLIICILFVGVFTATTNAFTGFITYYIIEFIRDMYDKRNTHEGKD